MDPSASGASSNDFEDWELSNDDGFVFRRPKRRRVDPDAEASASSSPATDLPEDPEKMRRERKKSALLRLKSRYQAEIDHWGILSSTLRALEERAPEQQQLQEQQRRESTASLGGCGSEEVPGSDCGLVVDELLSQAEAHEAIVRDVSNLCDIAEAMCNAEEEQIAQSLFDLPVWASPQELMAALQL